MKKKALTAALAAAFVLTTAGSVFAAPIDFSGDVKLHYRWETQTGSDDTSGGKLWFRLNAKTEVAKNVDAYARFASQHLTNDHIGADFNSTYYGTSSATSLDRFGFIVKGKDFNYTIGRQGTTLGGLALMYSTDGYMGEGIGAIDGVTVTGKSGVTNIKAVAGEVWDDKAATQKLYALDASYSPAKDLTVGGTLIRTTSADDINYWGVNAAYTTGKATWLGEYSKANSDAGDKAYAYGVSYAFDSKNSAYTFYSSAGSAYPFTDFDQNMKGMYYGVSHKITKDYTFDLFYKDMEYIDGTDAGKDKTSLRTTVTYKF